MSYSAIARMLNESVVLSPSAADRARNSHRDPNGWAASAVRAILTNPRYTGHEVWNRQRRDYDLLDPTAPADGHVRRMRWNGRDSWIWSPEPTHEALVDRDEWHRVQATQSGEPRASPRHDDAISAPRTCALRSLRPAHDWRARGNDRRYYRCELRRSRPGALIDHPVDVYVREQPLVEALDDWLNELFAPDHAAETARAIVDAAANDPAHQARVDHARRSIADAQRRLSQYRAALDGGADPATVTAWISDAATDERSAQAELDHLATQAPAPLTSDEALAVVDQVSGMPGLLEQADQSDRAALYAALGVSATYDPTIRRAELTVAIPRGAKNVSERRLPPNAHRRCCEAFCRSRCQRGSGATRQRSSSPGTRSGCAGPRVEPCLPSGAPRQGHRSR